VSQSEQRLRRRMSSAEELRSVTRTMKGLAAVNVRQFEQAAGVIDEYQSVVERALQVVLRDSPSGPGAERLRTEVTEAAVIVFGSNQGLCGPINRRVAVSTQQHIDRLDVPVRTVVAVGTRLATELEVAGLQVTDRLELPHTIENIARRGQRLLEMMDRWRQEQPGLGVWLSFPLYEGRRGSYRPNTLQLVPVSPEWLSQVASRPWPTHVLPDYAPPREALLRALIRHQLLVALHRSMAQTMAAIAASRLAAMQVAERDIEERLARLNQEHHQLRQAQITEELLDIVSGFDVLRGPGWSSP
jgi:F-type H+-transporting ATPase subunit gamma